MSADHLFQFSSQHVIRQMLMEICQQRHDALRLRYKIAFLPYIKWLFLVGDSDITSQGPQVFDHQLNICQAVIAEKSFPFYLLMIRTASSAQAIHA